MGNRRKSKGILALTASAAVWLSAPNSLNASEATMFLGLAIGGTHSPLFTAIGGTHNPVTSAIGGTHNPVTSAIGGTHEPIAVAVPGGLVVELISVIDEVRPAKGEIRVLGQTVRFDVTDEYLLSKVTHASAGAHSKFVLLIDQKLATITLIDFESTGASYVSGSTRVSLIGFVSESYPLIGKALVGQQLIDYSSALSNTPNVFLKRGQFIIISGTQPLPNGEFFTNRISTP